MRFGSLWYWLRGIARNASGHAAPVAAAVPPQLSIAPRSAARTGHIPVTGSGLRRVGRGGRIAGLALALSLTLAAQSGPSLVKPTHPAAQNSPSRAAPATNPPAAGATTAHSAAAQTLAAAGSAARGRALFTGRVHFQNGGPACAECHTIAGLGFPGGGTLAPDLTGSYERVGAVGMQYAVRTLFFPAMEPIYRQHQLTLAEQADLLAFFAAAPSQPASDNTGKIILIAVIGCLILFALTGFFWRDRVRGVRAPLVRRAREAARQRRAGAGAAPPPLAGTASDTPDAGGAR
ncbi:MAG: hypothetical protein ACRD17_05565 [Terriglobales bacterium]